MSHTHDFTVPVLGVAKVTSPINYSNADGAKIASFVEDDDRVILNTNAPPDGESVTYRASECLEKAGPRQKLYFAPGHVHAGIVTCGGLCPGLNDVIRAITRCLWYRYGVKRISGIQFGYRGLLPDYGIPTMPLNPDVVDDIHKIGGTILGSSRGGGTRTEDLVDTIERMNLNILFTIGGDGTQKGALAIAEEIERRKLKIAVVGIPKTIDNDLSFTDKSFGFETAVAKATSVVSGAHAEAHSAINGIGLVKVMGRDSGFIASHTALASHEVNFVLIPEVRFELDGETGFLHHLQRRLERRNHAVVVVAEGAGQHLLERSSTTDASGNRAYGDIGTYLRDAITRHFQKLDIEINLKYIDPSYIIRSAVAEPTDSVYCSRLGHNAVHAAMAGKTKVLMGLINNTFVHLPIAVAVSSRNHVNPESSLWRDVIEATHQPVQMGVSAADESPATDGPTDDQTDDATAASGTT
ncbi:MAG: ATP-dependent 6-phosphofructokinase [Spirochaetaceae bacterium]|nr:MAG: ATP-dependent 6-phosphofructokinase [Spirochaetaceae bacterium]